MASGGLETIKRLGQWGGAVIFYSNVAIWVREFLTHPDRDVFVDMIGSVVTLHSLYLGAAVGSAILALGCSLPVISWASGVYKRNSPAGKFRRLHADTALELNLTERDAAYEVEGRPPPAPMR